MRVVTKRTGLSADLLRAWERRHDVIHPQRSASGQRLYSDADIERLHLLYQATISGRSIGQVAKLPTRALPTLIREDATAAEPVARRRGPHATEAMASRAMAHTTAGAHSQSAREYLDDCMRAAKRLDGARLGAALRSATVSLHAGDFLDALVVPLLESIGPGWRPGTLSPAHGHLARAVLRRTLDNAIAEASSPAATAGVVVGTPAGEVHEFGALLAAMSAAIEGWRVTYLGTNLPAEHIASAAAITKARAVALSIDHPKPDPSLGDEFRRLRRALPRKVMLVVGGAASSTYGAALDEIGAIRPADLAGLRQQLRALRSARA